MARRGMSILELMVVIAILLALASVIVPAMVTWSRSSRMPEAQTQVEAALMMARADAQRQAAPVRVMAREGAGGVIELVSETVTLPAHPEAVAPGEGEAALEAPRVSTVYSLPRGVSVSDVSQEETSVESTDGSAPVPTSPNPDLGSASGGATSAGSTDRSQGVLLAVFLPDGEALRPGPRYLVDGSGRRMEVVVEPMSGRIVIRPVARPASRAVEARVPEREDGR